MAESPQVEAALRRLRSPGVIGAVAGLKAVADANGMPPSGRALQFGTKEAPRAVVLRYAPGSTHEKVYQAAAAAIQQET